MTRRAIAVVIPAHDAAAVLDTTLASVAAQRRRPDEVVVVDDGSTDATAEVAERWLDVLPLQVVRQPNEGPAGARRAGVAATTSPLLAFVDADDVWLPDHLEIAAGVHERSGGLVSPDAYSWRPGAPLPAATRRARFAVPPPRRQRARLLRSNFVFSSVLLARRDYDGAGGFRDGVTGAEDWDLWIRLVRRGVVVHGTPGATWLYRVAGPSLTDRPEMRRTYEEVLRRALRDGATSGERHAAEQHLTWLRARDCLEAAYAAARSGDGDAARRLAAGATAGASRVTVEAAALRLAPRAAVRVGDLARARWAGGRR